MEKKRTILNSAEAAISLEHDVIFLRDLHIMRMSNEGVNITKLIELALDRLAARTEAQIENELTDAEAIEFLHMEGKKFIVLSTHL